MTDVQPGTDAEIQQDRPGTASTRRVVLMGAGAVGATAVLSACGTAGTSGTNPNGTDFGDNPVPAGSAAAEGGGDAGGDTGGGGTGNVLVATSKVAVGSGVILDEVVVTQPAEGTYKAFSNVCTHQGCKVSEIKDGQIICKCHNSLFSIKDGAPTSGPAGQPLAAVAIDVDGDNVVTAA